MPWVMAAMAAAQMLQQQQKEKETRNQLANQQRYQAFTHNKPTGEIDYANPSGVGMSTWAGLQQQKQAEANNEAERTLKEAQARSYDRGASSVYMQPPAASPTTAANQSYGTPYAYNWLDAFQKG